MNFCPVSFPQKITHLPSLEHSQADSLTLCVKNIGKTLKRFYQFSARHTSSWFYVNKKCSAGVNLSILITCCTAVENVSSPGQMEQLLPTSHRLLSKLVETKSLKDIGSNAMIFLLCFPQYPRRHPRMFSHTQTPGPP